MLTLLTSLIICMKLYIRGYYSSCMKNVRFTFRHAILKKKKKNNNKKSGTHSRLGSKRPMCLSVLDTSTNTVEGP